MSSRAFLATPSPDVIRPAGPSGTLPVSTVFLPKEHGSWSLALEPLALGLLLAPSLAGVALATAALAGFFARRPLKAVFCAEPERARAARVPLILLAALAIIALVESTLSAGPIALWPLLLAVPFGGVFIYFDIQNEARAAVAELVGCATFGFLPVALATVAGWSVPSALALLVLALTRSLPTVLTVRTYLRLQKGHQPETLSPVLAGALAVGLTAFLAWHQFLPWLATGLAGLMLVRTLWLLSPRRPTLPAKQVGIIEAIMGMLYVGGLTLAYHW